MLKVRAPAPMPAATLTPSRLLAIPAPFAVAQQLIGRKFKSSLAHPA